MLLHDSFWSLKQMERNVQPRTASPGLGENSGDKHLGPAAQHW